MRLSLRLRLNPHYWKSNRLTSKSSNTDWAVPLRLNDSEGDLTWCSLRVNDTEGDINLKPSPCQWHEKKFSTANSWIDYYSREARSNSLTAALSGVTVQNLDMVFTTAVFEYFSFSFAVTWAGFVGSYCHQTIGKWQKLQYIKDFFLCLLLVQKFHFYNDSMENAF